MLKKCRVVMLTTNEKANIGDFCISQYDAYKHDNFLICGFKSNESEGIEEKRQHLYLFSDDEIKDGDWCIYKNRFGALLLCRAKNGKYGRVYQEQNEDYGDIDGGITPLNDEIFKIIATTDSSLTDKTRFGNAFQFLEGIKLPQPSQSFIEKYVEEYNKGNVITEVMVEYEARTDFKNMLDALEGEAYKLKINQKDNTITIKKVKDSWSREEVESLIELAWATASAYGDNTDSKDCEDWINKNL